jgi:hypothetical protein
MCRLTTINYIAEDGWMKFNRLLDDATTQRWKEVHDGHSNPLSAGRWSDALKAQAIMESQPGPGEVWIEQEAIDVNYSTNSLVLFTVDPPDAAGLHQN